MWPVVIPNIFEGQWQFPNTARTAAPADVQGGCERVYAPPAAAAANPSQ